MKNAVWTLAVVLFIGAVSFTSLYYSNIVGNSSDNDILEDKLIHVDTNELLPVHKEKLNINFNSDVSDEKSLIIEANSVVDEFIIDPAFEKEVIKDKIPKSGLFATTMEIADLEGKIEINFSLKNISDQIMHIQHNSGQQYEIWVYNEQDEEVYRWSSDKVFTQAIIEIELNGNEEIVFSEEWNLRDNEGNLISTGKYTIVVKVMIKLKSETISLDELTARSILEIK